jgi:hypothetical protein
MNVRVEQSGPVARRTVDGCDEVPGTVILLSLSHFQQKTTGLPAQGLASTISNFCCGSYRLPRVPEGGLPAEVRVRHPWEARLVRVV